MGTYFIAPGGVDGGGHTGAVGDPWATLAYALGQVGAGDLIQVRGGTYAQHVIGPGLHSGTSWASPIRIQAYPTEVPWFAPTSGGTAAVFEFSVDESYLEFDGIHVDASAGGVTAGALAIVGWSGGVGHHIRWKNAKIKAGGSAPSAPGRVGISCGASLATMAADSEFTNLEIYGVGSGATIAEYGAIVQSSRNVFRDCQFHDFAGGAWLVDNGWGWTPQGNQFINPVITRILAAP